MSRSTPLPTLRPDPNPCRRYPWTMACACVYSGAHVCRRPGGHPGKCVCAACELRASGPDLADDVARGG